MRCFNSTILVGGSPSSSWLKPGIPSSSNVSIVAPSGASSSAARSGPRLKDCCRRLPAIPKMTNGLFTTVSSLCARSSLCNLCVLCVSVVHYYSEKTTTETQSTQRLHREERLQTKCFSRKGAKKAAALCTRNTQNHH